MSFTVKIIPANIEYQVEVGQDLLTAALEAKLNLPHGCKDGQCASCKGKIIAGGFTLAEYNTKALTTEEREHGLVLLCKTFALSDVTLEIPGFFGGHPIRTLPAKITAIDKIGTVAIVKLRLPANQILLYGAGQYIDIMFEGKMRSYSIANGPNPDGIIELHIRYREGGVFSEAVWNKFQIGQVLRFKGPLGGFKLQESAKPILMVCTGTGFAPIKAILEYMHTQNIKRSVNLVWGNYIAADFYQLEILEQLRRELKINLTLCINDGQVAGFSNCLVTDWVRENFAQLDDYEVYACGNIAMIRDLYELTTTQLHLPANKFFSDAFTPSI